MNFTRVFVLGATGRIGRILRACWKGADNPGQVVWQARPHRAPQGAPQGASQGAGWAVLDPLEERAALARAASGADAILCLAGVVAGRGDPQDNVTLAEAAIRAAAGSGARVLLASSAAVYGDRAGPLDETAPLNPRNAYGRAKVDMEIRGAALGAELGVPVCALRIGNIAGTDSVLGGWKAGFRLDRFADGRTPRRSYIGALTLARVLGALVARRDLPPVLNVAQPGVVEMGALLDAAGLEWTPRPAPASAIPEVALSTAALSAVAGAPAPADPATLVREWRDFREMAP